MLDSCSSSKAQPFVNNSEGTGRIQHEKERLEKGTEEKEDQLVVTATPTVVKN